jgi:AraC family ethanolamine operon transcriptional activator
VRAIGQRTIAAIDAFDTAVHVRGTVPQGIIGFGFNLPGSRTLFWRGRPIGPHEMWLARGGSAMEASDLGAPQLGVLAVTTSAFDAAAEAVAHANLADLLRRSDVAPLAGGRATIGERLRGYLSELAAGRAAPLSPAAEAALIDDLVGLVADVADKPSTGAREGAARRLQRAEDYIRASSVGDLSLGALCRAVGSPERTLRHDFPTRFGIGPKAYLRRLRLNRARHDLRNGDAAHTSVTAVATAWGFYHLGEFAVAYRAFFGESPSQTLRSHQIGAEEQWGDLKHFAEIR